MDDSTIAEFTSITNATPDIARQYITLSDGNVEQAIQLFFESGGVDMAGSFDAPSQPPTAAPSAPTGGAASEPIAIDSDEDMSDGGIPINNNNNNQNTSTTEDDEAMARRLQEEAYGASGGVGGTGGMDVDPETGVRRPMARMQETLAGPMASGPVGRFAGYEDEEELQAAVREQMMARQSRNSRPGIFNQRPPPTNALWDSDADATQRESDLSASTGGASHNLSKGARLAEMYRPPFELMSKTVSWDGLRAEGKEEGKWILLNIQAANVFDCQVLNRDIWKNEDVRQTVQAHFVFKQYAREDRQASQYIQYYFRDHMNEDAYPHIAIVDPRTGEQVKVWGGSPVPKPIEFLSQLHEFLDRYSLDSTSRNPVATRKAEKKAKDVERMTEEEMLEAAIQSSLQGSKGKTKAEDPDQMTKPDAPPSPPSTNGDAGTSKATKATSPFDQISSSQPHTEPAADPTTTTRIQFRHPGGRVVRRFGLQEPVRRLFEWLKAAPLETREGQSFELVFMGKNLVESIDATIEQAGLKNGSVMVEFVEE